MPGSYRKINYSLRPAKHTQRKMLVEAFRKLGQFDAVDSYRYVGLGSIYFGDFQLFHKTLGITDMVCVESEIQDRPRFEFNSPFGCVSMQFGTSTDVLPLIPWGSLKTILWLDYDEKLQRSMLTDVSLFCANACVGSVLVITVDAEPPNFKSKSTPDELRQKATSALRVLKRRVGRDNVPGEIRGTDLNGWGTGLIYHRIITNSIAQALADRNGLLPSNSKIKYEQLFHFNYADGHKMLTVGGILCDERLSEQLNQCRFQDLEFIRRDNGQDFNQRPYLIEIPKLTNREIRQLDKRLPARNVEQLKALIRMQRDLNLPRDDLKRYKNLYRFFPTFAETDF